MKADLAEEAHRQKVAEVERERQLAPKLGDGKLEASSNFRK
jgi:hypothetical protein